MIKRELAKDPKLAGQDWSRFLPKFGKRKAAKKPIGTGPNAIEAGPSNSVAPSSSHVTPSTHFVPPLALANHKKNKKPYTPFPPAQTPRKIDLQLESGEYFLKPHEKKRKELDVKHEKERVATKERKERRAEMFEAPVEAETNGASEQKVKKRKRTHEDSPRPGHEND